MEHHSSTSTSTIPPVNTTLEQVVSATLSLPLEDQLEVIKTDAKNAVSRGYYLPDEDDRLRVIYSDYHRIRYILLQAVLALPAKPKQANSSKHNIEEFTIAYTAACALIRSTSYIIDIAKQNPIIWDKLDEEESRYNIQRKSLTRLYKNLTKPYNMWQFMQATKFFQQEEAEINALAFKSPLHQELINILKEEIPFIRSKKRVFIQSKLKFQLYDFIRRHKSGYRKAMFHLFRLSGSAIAEMRQPFKASAQTSKKDKQSTPEIIRQAQSLLQPADIIVTRHNDAMSNLFLPGFWPHAALYIGGDDPDLHIIEAKKDGVKYRNIQETLNVDCFLILRPSIPPSATAQIINKAKTHVGKRYDFLFEFTKSNRLACTELIYRSFHATADIHFQLNNCAGRQCLSAEDLINQAITSQKFSCVAIFGVTDTTTIHEGSDALEILRESYNSQW